MNCNWFERGLVGIVFLVISVSNFDDRPLTRLEIIQKQFSAWDGSHNEQNHRIKRAMNDPDSYSHVETKYVDMDDYLLVTTTLRGKNAFGAVMLNTILAAVSLDGKQIEILKNG